MKYLLLFILFVLTFSQTFAATVSFESQDSSVGFEETFLVGVNATTEEAVNAFEVVIDVPKELVPVDVSDGNSIILLWVERPVFDEAAHTLSFSGVVPNGFSGKDGRLVTITFTSASIGTATLSLNAASTFYAGEGETVALASVPLTLPVVSGKKNIINTIPDESPPEAFELTLAEDLTLADGKKVLIFSTTDKGSGIARYEVRESWFGRDSDRGWKATESPYTLEDQDRTTYVYIRAIDKQGNTYTAVLPPERLPALVYVLPVLVFIAMLLFIVYGRRLLRAQ